MLSRQKYLRRSARRTKSVGSSVHLWMCIACLSTIGCSIATPSYDVATAKPPAVVAPTASPVRADTVPSAAVSSTADAVQSATRSPTSAPQRDAVADFRSTARC